MSTAEARLDRARVALEGLSVGDAFGERFFVHPDVVGGLIAERALPAPPCPAEDVEVFNANIVGPITVLATYPMREPKAEGSTRREHTRQGARL